MTDPKSFAYGSTALVIGPEDAIRKKLHTVNFTRHFMKDEIEDPTMFTPRAFIGTSGRVDSGVDCDDVSLVAMMGTPTSIIHVIQQIRLRGRKNAGNQKGILNCYHIMLTLHDFVYSNEHLVYEEYSEIEGV